jgi:hypothetical protein
MNRTDFINHFKAHNPDEANSDWPFLEFKILLTSTANSDALNLMYVNSKLETMYESLNISNGYLLNKGDINFEYDYYYEDDYPESDYCQYKADLNLNILYDKLVENNIINNPELISLYRIETANHKGLYDGVGYNILLSAPEDKHPGPEKDPQFMRIFDHSGYLLDNVYKSKWMFAFSDENQVKEWLSNKDIFDKLVQADFKLNKITIKADNVIIGDAQAIYIGKNVEKTEIFPLKSLEHLFNEKRKNKLTF